MQPYVEEKRSSSKRQRKDDYGQRYELATAMYDGPRTAEELTEHLRSYLKLLGLFSVYARLQTERPQERLLESIHHALDEMMDAGWVVREGDRYALTELGRMEAEKPLNDFRRARETLAVMAQPTTVSKVSLAIHLALAAIKLPVGLISGSVGLINDGVDTLLDGFASLLVYAGIRYDRERLANVVLVVMMLGTGGYALYEAVSRFFVPVQPVIEWSAYAAVVASALFCGFLWLYQRLIGLQSGNMALITQSIDSRNHVIVAASVTVGLIAAAFNVPFLDTLVGTVVAALILKSAVEIALEVIRNWNAEAFDLSSYRLGLLERYKTFRQDQFCQWLLFLVYGGHVTTREGLRRQAQDALNFDGNRTLNELGFTGQLDRRKAAEDAIETVFAEGWLVDGDTIQLTEVGRAHLETAARGIWMKPGYTSTKSMEADMAHYLGRVAHDGRGFQRRRRRRDVDARTVNEDDKPIPPDGV